MSNVRTIGFFAVLGAFALVGGCSSDDSTATPTTTDSGAGDTGTGAETGAKADAGPACYTPTSCTSVLPVCCLTVDVAALTGGGSGAAAPVCAATCTGLTSVKFCASATDCASTDPCIDVSTLTGLGAGLAGQAPPGTKICETSTIKTFLGGGGGNDAGTDAAKTDSGATDAGTDAAKVDSGATDAGTDAGPVDAATGG